MYLHALFIALCIYCRCGGLVRWAVLFLGELERSSRYSFEIKLMGGEHPKSLTLTSTCGVVTDDGEEVRNSDAVFTFYKLAKRYCHGSNLKCNVKILARSDGEFWWFQVLRFIFLMKIIFVNKIDVIKDSDNYTIYCSTSFKIAIFWENIIRNKLLGNLKPVFFYNFFGKWFKNI